MMALMKQALPAREWGATQGWWAKTVQLDAEARGEVVRDGGKPLPWKKKKPESRGLLCDWRGRLLLRSRSRNGRRG